LVRALTRPDPTRTLGRVRVRFKKSAPNPTLGPAYVQSTEEKEDKENEKDDVSLLNKITISIKTLKRTETEMTDINADTETNSLSINVNLF